MGIEKNNLIINMENPTNDSYNFEDDKKSLEILKIDIQNNTDIMVKKKTALLQAIELLEMVNCYGELDNEVYKLKDGIKDADFNIKELENDLEDINEK